MIATTINLNGSVYPIVAGSYIREWVRSYTSYLSAGVLRYNFIDRGPGVQTYSFQIPLVNWGTNSLPYLAGVTQTPEQQLATLDATYSLVATPVAFTDPFGNVNPYGVYVTDWKVSIPLYATKEQTYAIGTIQLTSATQPAN